MNTKNTPGRRRHGQDGFTLVEIMVVIVILGLLGTMVVTNVVGMSDDARKEIARTNAKALYEGARLWRTQKGTWPTLEQLTTEDDKGNIAVENVGDDPWDNPYELREIDSRNIEVISYGPDGSPDTDDDISSRSVDRDK